MQYTKPNESEKTNAVKELLSELSKGKKSAQEKGWISFSDLEKILDITNS